jgi:hypothetical protein
LINLEADLFICYLLPFHVLPGSIARAFKTMARLASPQ